LHLDLPGAAGDVGWPRTLRGAPAGHSDWPGRKTIDRPSRASRRSPGTKTKVRNPGERGDQPLHRATWCHSPGRVVIAVRSLPWPRPSRPVDTKSMCPLSVLPSPRPPHPSWMALPLSCGPQLKFGGKGGLRAPFGKDYPPNPPLRSGQIIWGVRGHGRALHLAWRQLDGGGTRRPGYAGTDPPPDPLPTNKREGEVAAHCLQPNRRLTMSSRKKHAAAHRKPA
jgi:hypothetical protein